MTYAIIIAGEVSEYPVDLRERLPNTSMRENWPGGEIEGITYAQVEPAPQPNHDPATQNLVEGTPALVAGVWTQQWTITDASPAEIAERLEARRAAMSCTPRQARLALAFAGMLQAVEAWVAEQGEATRIEWEYASEIRRTVGLVTSAATELGMTEEQIDDLFAYAVNL